ncbi:MAG: asparagine synthase (glutamine-hydrolyzing) [Oscillospiraceae bacterium]|jgi:asparagine synthase (glutamine-hydrolysing)|nr:asparagine synthase (glutamine-hydrolyzing) [Oscillospiraceae bacterium]
MCGIAGWVDYNKNLQHENQIADKMSRTLAKRGPDEHGSLFTTHALLLHRRLSVIDKNGGRQPMTFSNAGETYTITYNGELYNTNEIRNKLLLKGFNFESHSDTEVVLKSYIYWKNECLEHFNGIFGFGVWEHNSKKLFLARDRIGVKPLFFVDYNNGIIFGSEIKTLLAHPKIRPEVSKEGLNEIFLLGPARTASMGIVGGIKELERGNYLEFTHNRIFKKKYWQIRAKEFYDGEKIAIKKVKALIFDAIKRQLVSDVPLCTFLSGGLDSSIISTVAAEHYKNLNNTKLTTYSVDYKDNHKYFIKSFFQPNSDKEYIKTMSNFLSSNHKNIILDNFALINALDESTFARDLPGMADIDSSLLLFCKEIKKDFTVALSGECADEIFGGYPWYHDKKLLFFDGFPWSRSLEIRKNIVRENFLINPDEYVREKYLQTINTVDKLPTDTKFNNRIREMFILNLDWFMQTLLDRKDRMSMFSGLEIRVPFCDHRIVEYAYNMPWSIKTLNGREKGIVREALKNTLPKNIVERKKSPYPKTFNPFYMQAVSKEVIKILHKKTLLKEILNHNFIINIIENPEKIKDPWYGQLMGAPQVLAYIVQLDRWFDRYKIQII